MKYSISQKEILELCSIQAEIFESSIDNGKSEIDFISKYMKSVYAKSIDVGEYWISSADKVEIIDRISKISKDKKNTSYEKPILHFIGYFYRYYCFKYEMFSVVAWKEVDFEYLYQNFNVLHSFDIDKACEVVHDIYFVSRDTK